MPDFIYQGARPDGTWYYGARPDGPIMLGPTPLIPDAGGGGGGDAVTMHWDINSLTGPIPNVGDGPATDLIYRNWDNILPLPGDDGRIAMRRYCYMVANPTMDFGLADTGNPADTYTPSRFRMGIKCKPTAEYNIMMEYFVWDRCQFSFWFHDWNRLRFNVSRPKAGVNIEQLSVRAPDKVRMGDLRFYEVEWVNNPDTGGGTVTFYVDGEVLGAPYVIAGKVGAFPGERLNINASLDNPVNGKLMEVEFIELTYQA